MDDHAAAYDECVKAEMEQTVYYPNHRRHDTDNSVPKFILDGFVDSGMVVDDDSEHISKLTLVCRVDVTHPRTELKIRYDSHKALEK